MDHKAKRVLASNLRHYRLEKGLSQDELASKAGISLRVYQQIEAGKGNPTLETGMALAGSLNLTGWQLFSLQNARIEGDGPDFISLFKAKFEDANYGVVLRPIGGTSLWGNSYFFLNVHKFQKAFQGPFSFLDFYEKDSHEFFKNLLDMELKGYVLPIHVVFKQKHLKEAIPIRVQPTKILTADGRRVVLLANFVEKIGEESEINYYDFCNRLLDAVKGDPK